MPKLTPEQQRELAEARAAKATARAEAKAAAERKKKAKDEKKAMRAAAVQRRAAIVTAQPHPQRNWPAEREEEEKRIKKLRKQLARRTRKDLSKHAMFQKPVALPPPIEQPDLADDATAAAPPPREGLIPGTYRLVDPDRYAGSLLDPDPLPPMWTGRHVGRRLIEAMDVLRRAPERVGPKSYGAAWPSYRHEAGEHAVQAGAGTLAIGRNIVVRSVGADEAARAAEALQWPLQYLNHCNAWSLLTLNGWADDPADDAPPPHVATMLETIATALNAAKEPVR